MKLDLTGSPMTATDAMYLGDEYFVSLVDQKAKPDLLTTASAAFKLHNPLSSSVESHQLKKAYEGTEGFTTQPDYNVYDTLEEQYWGEPEYFQDVQSPEEAAFVKASIDSQYRNREILAQAGGSGIVMAMAAGTLDPILAPLSLLGGLGVGAGAGALRGAALATGEMALQEMMLHDQQITRTWQESMYAVGAAPVFGATFGAIGGAMTKSQINKAIKDIQGDIDDIAKNGGIRQEEGQSVGAASGIGTLAEEQPIGRQGPAVSPQMRLLKSRAPSFVNFLNNTSRHDLQIGKNMRKVDYPETRTLDADGNEVITPAGTRIEYGESVTPMETSLVRELHQNALSVLYATGTNYQQYIGAATKTGARLQGRISRGSMSLPDFRKEIGYAMRKGDLHENPHVQKAAQDIRRSLDDALERQKAVGMLPDDVKPKYALSYLMRTYDTKYIRAHRTEWDGMLKQHYMGKGMDELEARQAADDVTKHILIHGVNPTTTKRPTPSPTKSRTLDIEDTVLSPFLVNDIQSIMDAYMRKTMPTLHWLERFETTDLDALIQKGTDEYTALINKAKDSGAKEKVIQGLEDQLARDIVDIENAQKMYLGHFNLPKGLEQKITNASRSIRGLTVAANLGSMTLAALPDISMQIFKNGMGNTAQGFMQFVSSVGKKGRVSRKAITESGVAAEMTLASRMLSVTDLQDLPPVGQAIMKTFGNVALMGPWNAMQKTTAAFAAQNRIIKTIMNYDSARPMRKSIMASEGIGDNTAKAMLKELEQHATKFRGGWIPNTIEWSDRALAKKFDDVIFGFTENTIVTPGQLDRPTALNYETGKFLFMFKSFMFASHHQLLLPLVQRLPQGDLQVLNGMLVTGSLAMLSEWSRLLTSQRMDEIDKYSAQDWARAAVDRSGWLALPMDGINIADRVTEGRISRNLGLKEGSKYFYKDKSSMIMGPAGATVLGLTNALANLTSEDGVTASDIHGVRRILPYQNLFYTRWLFNQVEEALQEGRTNNRRQR